ncbi:MAG: conserved rane protein of unknown function [Pseudonocardiales bacterium]|nr:conserved rane protein of unknown function [Pseudonocardiales bacterium]
MSSNVSIDAPSWNDPTAARASNAIGGPIGRYAATSRMWSPLLVLLLMTATTLLFAYGEKSPCADGQWTGNKQYTHMCYSDVIPLWGAEELDTGAVPYRDHAVEYPVLTGGFMWLSAEVTRAAGSQMTNPSLVLVFGVVTCIGLAICAFLVTYFTAGTVRRRPWDAAIFAASPLLIFHAYSNWDLFAMVFAAAALWAWARERPLLAGTLIGLGAAAKLYPVFILVAIFMVAVRSDKWRGFVWASVAAGLAWLAVNLPVASAYFDGWKEFYVFSADRDAEASTFYAMAQYFNTGGFNKGSPGGYVPSGVLVGFVLLVALGVVGVIVLTAPRRPRLAQVVLLVVVAFLLTTKVWSPQYSLWLVPLVALARPRWRIALLWQASEILVWIVTLLWLSGLGDVNRAIDYGWLMTVILVRDGFLITICALVVREMWHPELDIVRAGGQDDPGGGEFDGAPDGFSMSAGARELRRLQLASWDDSGDSPPLTPPQQHPDFRA